MWIILLMWSVSYVVTMWNMRFCFVAKSFFVVELMVPFYLESWGCMTTYDNRGLIPVFYILLLVSSYNHSVFTVWHILGAIVKYVEHEIIFHCKIFLCGWDDGCIFSQVMQKHGNARQQKAYPCLLLITTNFFLGS